MVDRKDLLVFQKVLIGISAQIWVRLNLNWKIKYAYRMNLKLLKKSFIKDDIRSCFPPWCWMWPLLLASLILMASHPFDGIHFSASFLSVAVVVFSFSIISAGVPVGSGSRIVAGVPVVSRARIWKHLRSPWIDSGSLAGGTTIRAVELGRQAGNRFLGSLKGLQLPAQVWHWCWGSYLLYLVRLALSIWLERFH